VADIIITVVSRITGLAAATLLSRNHKVTVIARNLPGDDPCIEWASPWAGAVGVMGGVSSARDKKMQLCSFYELWDMSLLYPESSLRRITAEDVFNDDRSEDGIWWRDFMPEVCKYLYC